MLMSGKKNRSRIGQTLVEAMVAMTILTTGLLGMFTLLSRSFFIGRNLEDQTKGTYLAAEGIELAKNMIDHDVYLGLATGGAAGGWGVCFPFGVGGNADYEIDYATKACPLTTFLGTGRKLNFNAATDLYGYGAGTPTSYVRRIRITKPSANEIDVQSIVTWSTGPLNGQSITLEDHFYNWHP